MKTNSLGGGSLVHRPPLTVQELDNLDYVAKIRHWMRDDAWSPGGTRLRFENPVYRIGNFTIVEGDITAAKPLVGRPCFGIATALLRYEHATRYVQGRGAVPAGRCQACKSKDACRWVVTNRLKSAPSLESAWINWLQEGGPTMFYAPNYKDSAGQRSWAALCRELRSVSFSSANDQHVLAAYAEKDRLKLENDAARKAQDRRRARRKGEIDEADIELLKAAARRRAETLVAIREGDDCPRNLAVVPTQSLKDMIQVWLGREVMSASKQKPNAPNIARWLVATGRSDAPSGHAALSSRVHKDLKRIEVLERLRWNGEFVLARLDRSTEFPSQQEI